MNHVRLKRSTREPLDKLASQVNPDVTALLPILYNNKTSKLNFPNFQQMSKIAMQQEALGQLQAGLIDELESKGTFQDPETQKIMEKYQKVQR